MPDPQPQPSEVPVYPAEGFVFHHSGGTTLAGLEATLKDRGLGSQYLMDRDGTIVNYAGAGAPHIQPNDQYGGVAPGLSNKNAVGMELVARDDADVTPAQVQSAKDFIARNYPNTPVYGHGEVNPGHKQASEGLTVANAIRADRAAAPPSAFSAFSPSSAEAAPPPVSGGTRMASDWEIVPQPQAQAPTPAPAAQAAPAPTAAAPEPDWDAIKGGDYSSVGGQATRQPQAPSGPATIGAAPSPTRTLPGAPQPDAAPAESLPTRYLHALRARAGVPPEGVPQTPPTGDPIKDLMAGAEGIPQVAQQAMALPGNAVAAIGDVTGHPVLGSAGKFVTDFAPFVIGGYAGARALYGRLAAGDMTAMEEWNAARQAMADWQAQRGPFVPSGQARVPPPSWQAANAAEAENASRAAAARAYDAQAQAAQDAAVQENTRRIGATQDYNAANWQNAQPRPVDVPGVPRTTPRLVPVPERLPYPTPPPMETRLLATGPPPNQTPAVPFPRFLATQVAPRLIRGALYAGGLKAGLQAGQALRELAAAARQNR